MDIESYIQSLLVANPLRESTLRAMIKALQLPTGFTGFHFKPAGLLRIIHLYNVLG
ncbi:unnamed protein product [marine sediment metagenome]|jgi:hypothetical protein|uniref:Uncharacterized protein n=1 Tax=marine sediment metagenome TaxID=412755 RepID=X1IPH1_9ZZZZ